VRCKYKALLVVLLVFFSMSVCQAEERKDEWKKPGFNFDSIRTILVSTSIDPQAELERWGKTNFRFITSNQLKERISNVTGVDMQQLEIDDQARYKAEMDRVTPSIVDAILHINVTAFGYDQRFVPESSRTYKEQEEKEVEVDVRDSTGKWVKKKVKVKEPVQRTVITPAHYETYANAGLTYMLVDTKTNETVWMLLDIREARGKDPMAMTGRIITRAAKCFAKL
jgi:hypothetical protein